MEWDINQRYKKIDKKHRSTSLHADSADFKRLHRNLIGKVRLLLHCRFSINFHIHLLAFIHVGGCLAPREDSDKGSFHQCDPSCHCRL